jgi:putative hydrolase of the HAD superfamily
VTPKKNVLELKELIESLDLSISKSWLIGNSLRSDINPATQLGMKGIWLHSNSWEYDIVENLPGNVWEIYTLKEVCSILNSVSSVPNQQSSYQPNY